MSAGTALLVIVVIAFAWNLGAHYTGAVMGMPFATGSIRLWPALALIAVFVVLGATFASERVQETVGLQIIPAGRIAIPTAIVVVASAGLLTAVYNWLRVPTSTIQILVFCVVGAGLAERLPIEWATIGHLAAVWVSAPLVAFALGYAFTRLLDLVVAPADAHRGNGTAARVLPLLLVAVGVATSFTMGANDVANATGALVMVHLSRPMAAGLLGGAVMAIGVLSWGRRILKTVAFDVVTMDLSTAGAAQGVQALVVLAATTQGLFTSMNQALIGAMAGTGFARGRGTIKRAQVRGILGGWLIGPTTGFALAYIGETIASAVAR